VIIIGLTATIIVLVGIVLSLALEMRHRNIALAKVVAPDSLSTPPWLEILEAIAAALTPHPKADTTALAAALSDLKSLVPQQKGRHEMTAPTDLVQVSQGDLTKFASGFTDVFTALKGYIATLVANQAVPLAAADESGLAAALAAGEALEPPVPVTPTP
jgi:hypothetical protein